MEKMLQYCEQLKAGQEDMRRRLSSMERTVAVLGASECSMNLFGVTLFCFHCDCCIKTAVWLA